MGCCRPLEKIWWLADDTWLTKAVGTSLILFLQYQYREVGIISIAPGYLSYLLSMGLEEVLCFFVGGAVLSDSSIRRENLNSGGFFSRRNLLSFNLKLGGSSESCLFEQTCIQCFLYLCHAFESVTSSFFCCSAEEFEAMVNYNTVQYIV